MTNFDWLAFEVQILPSKVFRTHSYQFEQKLIDYD